MGRHPQVSGSAASKCPEINSSAPFPFPFPYLNKYHIRAVPELVAQLNIATTFGGGGLLLRASRSGSGRSTSARDAPSCVA